MPKSLKCVTLTVMHTLVRLQNPPLSNVFLTAVDAARLHNLPSAPSLPQPDPAATAALFEAAFSRLREEAPCYGHKNMTTRDWWRHVVEGVVYDPSFPIQYADPRVFEFFFQRFYSLLGSPKTYRAFPDEYPFLDWCRDRGLQLGVISNGNERHQDGLLPLFGLTDYFDFYVFAKETGYEKPNPKMFLRAVTEADVLPGEILHVGSHPVKDCEAAERVGLRAVLIDRDGFHRGSDWVKQGKPTCTNLMHVPDLIEKEGLVLPNTEAAEEQR